MKGMILAAAMCAATSALADGAANERFVVTTIPIAQGARPDAYGGVAIADRQTGNVAVCLPYRSENTDPTKPKDEKVHINCDTYSAFISEKK